MMLAVISDLHFDFISPHASVVYIFMSTRCLQEDSASQYVHRLVQHAAALLPLQMCENRFRMRFAFDYVFTSSRYVSAVFRLALSSLGSVSLRNRIFFMLTSLGDRMFPFLWKSGLGALRLPRNEALLLVGKLFLKFSVASWWYFELMQRCGPMPAFTSLERSFSYRIGASFCL